MDEVPEAPSAERPTVEISPDQIATILYTSGSTGAPKGVMQSHRNLLQHVRNYTNNLRVRRDDRLSLLFSYSFSASLLDLFGALLNGATLCPFDVRSKGTASLIRWVEARRITPRQTATIPREAHAPMETTVRPAKPNLPVGAHHGLPPASASVVSFARTLSGDSAAIR